MIFARTKRIFRRFQLCKIRKQKRLFWPISYTIAIKLRTKKDNRNGIKNSRFSNKKLAKRLKQLIKIKISKKKFIITRIKEVQSAQLHMIIILFMETPKLKGSRIFTETWIIYPIFLRDPILTPIILISRETMQLIALLLN